MCLHVQKPKVSEKLKPFLWEKPQLNSLKIQKWILPFLTKQIQQRSLGSWCIKANKESTLGYFLFKLLNFLQIIHFYFLIFVPVIFLEVVKLWADVKDFTLCLLFSFPSQRYGKYFWMDWITTYLQGGQCYGSCSNIHPTQAALRHRMGPYDFLENTFLSTIWNTGFSILQLPKTQRNSRTCITNSHYKVLSTGNQLVCNPNRCLCSAQCTCFFLFEQYRWILRLSLLADLSGWSYWSSLVCQQLGVFLIVLDEMLIHCRVATPPPPSQPIMLLVSMGGKGQHSLYPQSYKPL